MTRKRVDEITVKEPFEGLFPIDNGMLTTITRDMEARGYDEAQPIILWKEGGCILDGHTRLLAAQAAGIEDVPVAWKSFASEDAAVAYAIHCQRDRRNLTGADILRWVGELDRRKQRGGDHKSVEAKSKASSDAFDPKSAQTVAETIGTSTRKVEKARAILDYAPPEVKDAAMRNEISLNKAYTKTQEARKPHVAQNSGDNEWYTPNSYITIIRAVLGSIELDPASTDAANAIVRATSIYTAADNGLKREWKAKTLFLNPPYASDLVGKFIEKLAAEVETGNVAEAIVLVNNATETKWFARLAGVSAFLCFPGSRVKFWKPDKTPCAPLQGQCFAYIGKHGKKFCEAFKEFGITAQIVR